MATREIETFTEVHSMGDTRRPWNKGKPHRGSNGTDVRNTEARFRERRRRDAELALGMGVSAKFTTQALDYVNKAGEYSRG